MSYQPEDLLYEGKAKRVFSVQGHPDLLWHEFKNSLTALNGVKKGEFPNKGEINTKISSAIFRYLKKNGVNTHFVSELPPHVIVTQKLKMIPLEVVVRNQVAGSLQKRLGLEEGALISPPLVEFYYKKDELNDPFVSEAHIQMMELVTPSQVESLKHMALEVNHLLKSFFEKININLIDFKMEFGLESSGKIILADEVSPDTCRLWDKTTNEKLDKDRFRQDLGGIQSGYTEVLTRIQKQGEGV